MASHRRRVGTRVHGPLRVLEDGSPRWSAGARGRERVMKRTGGWNKTRIRQGVKNSGFEIPKLRRGRSTPTEQCTFAFSGGFLHGKVTIRLGVVWVVFDVTLIPGKLPTWCSIAGQVCITYSIKCNIEPGCLK